MNQQHFFKLSFYLSLSAFVVFVLTIAAAFIGGGNGGQEQFEFLQSIETYTAALKSADYSLRIVLFLDTIFILCYASAIGCAIAACYDRNKPFAWASGLALLGVIILDNWENIVMIQSLDLVAQNQAIEFTQMVSQVTVSSAKWIAATVLLFCISFLLPDRTTIEKLLVWGTRVGLAIGVPLFIYNPIDLRVLGGTIIALSMGGGFVLLALVMKGRRITK